MPVTINTDYGAFSGILVSSSQLSMTIAMPAESCPDSAKKLMHRYSNGYCIFSVPVRAETRLIWG